MRNIIVLFNQGHECFLIQIDPALLKRQLDTKCKHPNFFQIDVHVPVLVRLKDNSRYVGKGNFSQASLWAKQHEWKDNTTC